MAVNKGVEATGSGEVVVANVTKRFAETVAVRDLSLTIPHGAYCCLLGPSGCGKTTILRMIAGHERPTTACSTTWPLPSRCAAPACPSAMPRRASC